MIRAYTTAVGALAIALASGFATGCAHEVYSPPTRAMALESAGALSRGEESAQLELSQTNALFGPEIGAGTIRLRHGESDSREIQFEVTRAQVNGSPQPDVSPDAHAARVGVKTNTTDAKNVALEAGAGGGWSAAGTFASVDVGMVLSYEACHLTPTFAARGFVSEPLEAREVDTSGADEARGTHVDTPQTTYGFSATAGLSLALGRDTCSARAPVTFHAGVGFMQVTDLSDDEGYVQGSLGIEVSF